MKVARPLRALCGWSCDPDCQEFGVKELVRCLK